MMSVRQSATVTVVAIVVGGVIGFCARGWLENPPDRDSRPRLSSVQEQATREKEAPNSDVILEKPLGRESLSGSGARPVDRPDSTPLSGNPGNPSDQMFDFLGVEFPSVAALESNPSVNPTGHRLSDQQRELLARIVQAAKSRGAELSEHLRVAQRQVHEDFVARGQYREAVPGEPVRPSVAGNSTSVFGTGDGPPKVVEYRLMDIPELNAIQSERQSHSDAFWREVRSYFP